MERESYIEIAAKHAKRIGALELKKTELFEKFNPDCGENPANPLTIFNKLQMLRESTSKNLKFTGQSTLNIARESVFAYAEYTFAMDTLKKIISDASRVQEAFLNSQLTHSEIEYCILRDVVNIFGAKATYDYFKSQYVAGISKGRQQVLNSLEGGVPLSQYNRDSMGRILGIDEKGSISVKFPTAFEGIEVEYEYNENNKTPDISIFTSPVQ